MQYVKHFSYNSPSLEHFSFLNSVKQLLLPFLFCHLLQTSSVLRISHQVVVITIPELLVLR